jgi:hypothetical protein
MALVPQRFLGKEPTMEDFPIWLKLLIWLTVGGTVVYAVGAIIYSVMMGWREGLMKTEADIGTLTSRSIDYVDILIILLIALALLYSIWLIWRK